MNATLHNLVRADSFGLNESLFVFVSLFITVLAHLVYPAPQLDMQPREMKREDAGNKVARHAGKLTVVIRKRCAQS